MAAVRAVLPHVEELLAGSSPPVAGKRRKKQKRRRQQQGAGPAEVTEGVELGSVEWWAHSRRGAGAGHQLHFDLDEGALPGWRAAQAQAEGQVPVPHPEVSCVLYLDGTSAEEGGGRGGAPTLVLDQDVDGPAGVEPSKGWLCYPRANRGLLFRGGLLHGVVPASVLGVDEVREVQPQGQVHIALPPLPIPVAP